MLALCLMLLVTYNALNYASIIGRGLQAMAAAQPDDTALQLTATVYVSTAISSLPESSCQCALTRSSAIRLQEHHDPTFWSNSDVSFSTLCMVCHIQVSKLPNDSFLLAWNECRCSLMVPFLYSGCVYFTDRTGPLDRKFLFSKLSV